MSNESYFSRYESPNIIIVPTMSDNPSLPKRRKIGNNIVVPLVNNAVCEKTIKSTQENKTSDDTKTDKRVDKSACLPKSPSLKGSWASNYLQSIGLDKMSSIGNRKIPRKTVPQTRVVPVEPHKIIPTEVTSRSMVTSKIGAEKNYQSKISKPLVSNSNKNKDCNDIKDHIEKSERNVLKDKLKDSIKSTSKKNTSDEYNTETKLQIETKERNMKHKWKESKHESIKSTSIKSTSGLKNKIIKTNDFHKKVSHLQPNNISTNDSYQKGSHESPINNSTTGRHSIHAKSENVVNKTSRKCGNNSKVSPHSLVTCRERIKKLVNKTNIKSVVIKQNQEQDNKKFNIKTKQKTPKNDGAESSTSYIHNKYKEKYKNLSIFKGDLNSIKNVKITKNYDNLKKCAGPQNAHCDNELKNKLVHKTTEKSNKLNTNKKIKGKSDNSPKNKTIKSSIKKKTQSTKNCRKIKLVINLICNNNQNPQCTESKNKESDIGNNTSTAPNVDLEFLDDFNIDEIVESLDTCAVHPGQESDKHPNEISIHKHVISNNNNSNNNTDAMDLIKTLKGEEDDDLMRLSIENAKELLLSNNILTRGNENNSCTLDNVSKKSNSKNTNHHFANLVKNKEEKVEVLPEKQDVIPSTKIRPSKNFIVTKNVKTCNVNKTENVNRKQKIIYEKTVDKSNQDHSQSSSDNVRSGTLSIEVGKDIQEANKPPICNLNLVSQLDKRNTNLCKETKPLENLTKKIKQEKYERVPVFKDMYTNVVISPLEFQAVEHEDEQKQNNNKILHSHNPKNAKTASVDEIYKENSNSTVSTNMITEIHTKNVDNPNQENKQKETDTFITKTTKNVKNIDIQNNNQFSQCNNASTNLLDFNEDNKHDSVKNILKEESLMPGDKVQKEEYEGNKEGIVKEDVKKDKQKDLSIKETMQSQKKLSDNDENVLCYIKSRADLETAKRLEEQLFTHTGSKYSIVSIIRTGKFSEIFKCKHPNGKYYALKMQRTRIPFHLGRQKKQMLTSIVSDIPKDNLFIVSLIRSFNVDKNWCFLMEYYPRSLDQVLCEAEKPYSIDQIQDYAKQIVMAVMVLRNKNMVHMDINPRHILINSSNNMLKLCGFDSLCYINEIKVLPSLGTANYRAPELILGYRSSGFEIDVWSTGLVLYEMATNCKLFPGIYNNDILYKQICTLGCVPFDMIQKSRFGRVHFLGSKFMRKTGIQGQDVNIISKFYRNNKLCDSIYSAYFENWGNSRSISEQNCDIGKLRLFVKLLQNMLKVRPESRLPIEFAYANPFIYDAYSYQEW